MKTITVELTNEQFEIFEHICRLCEKSTSDFIKEALICLLPLNEYIEVKNQLIETHNEISPITSQTIHEINNSTSRRLKRIGIL